MLPWRKNFSNPAKTLVAASLNGQFAGRSGENALSYLFFSCVEKGRISKVRT